MKLQTKLILYALPIYLVVVTAMTLLSQFVVRTIVIQGEIKRGLSVGLSVGKNEEVVAGFQAGSETRLLPYLQFLQEHTQALYATALDQNGRVLAHTNVVETGKTYTDSTTLSVLKVEKPFFRRLMFENQDVVDLAVPVLVEQTDGTEEFLLMGGDTDRGQTRVGTLRMALPLDQSLSTAKSISRQVFWIITVGGALALVVGLIFIRRLLRPVHQLSRAAQRVGQGNLGETVVVSSTNEIGELTEQFNRMSRELAETTVSIETLRESQERFRRLADSAFEGIFIHQGSKIIDANDIFAQMLGYDTADDIIGMDGMKFVKRSDRRTALEYIRKGDERPFEIALVDQEGIEFPVEVIGKPIPYEGQTVGVVAIRDIRERVEAEEARRQLERQLIQSERMASVGTVAAGIVHNLKNPLTGVMGFAEILRMKNPDAEEVDYIVNSATQMQLMIENILSKSRQKQMPEPVDINELLNREIDFLRADRTFKTEVETEIQLADSLPQILCVYTDMSQVFGNLLRNAVEAMHDRSTKQMTVKSACEKEKIIVEIKDTGSGISEENLAHLFVPFFTTKTGDGKNEPQGTGLGLYTVKELLENFGGKIEVDSTVDVGTTFRVILPLQKQAYDASNTPI